MPKKKKDNKTHKRKKRRSKRKSKRIENFTDFNDIKINQKNIYDEPLKVCSKDPITGYHRSGYCFTDDIDQGTHTVCAKVNNKFLDYTKSKGNDLSTPRDNFPGLKEGDKWCLCALRWKEAMNSGKAPSLNLEATNHKTLEYIDKNTLEKYKI